MAPSYGMLWGSVVGGSAYLAIYPSWVSCVGPVRLMTVFDGILYLYAFYLYPASLLIERHCSKALYNARVRYLPATVSNTQKYIPPAIAPSSTSAPGCFRALPFTFY